ncbi:hypothetical protein BU15DRAFT_59770 [Melanogaster broomeanus]|nr:hypothetical protein BU15DRAFT_59770 [Melanogaster broomeanus]
MSPTDTHTQPEAGPSTPRAPAQPSRRPSWGGESAYGAEQSLLPDDFDLPSCPHRGLSAAHRNPPVAPLAACPEDTARCSAMINWTADHDETEEENEVLRVRSVGSIAGKEIKYICRRWKTSKQKEWYGFYSELALYKSERYLKPLQGDVVPHIIGVHVMPEAVSVTMEMPHSSFWIESSPSMPDVLKERVSSTATLSCGICSSAQTAASWIIDFGMSRAVREHESVSIEKAEPEEFRLEMRKVMYKLDYMGARKKEGDKVDDYLKRVRMNRKISNLWKRRGMGERVGPIPPYEEDPEEYKLEPPVNAQDFQEDWITASDDRPMRIVVPGLAPEEVADEVQAFIRLVGEMRSIPPSPIPCEPIPDDPTPPARLKRKLPAEASPTLATSDQSPATRSRPEPSPWGSSSAGVHMWYSDGMEGHETVAQFRRHQQPPHLRSTERGESAPGHPLKRRQPTHKVAALSVVRRRENDKFSLSARYVEGTAIRRDYMRQVWGIYQKLVLGEKKQNPEEYQMMQESAVIRYARVPRGILKRKRDDDSLSASGPLISRYGDYRI